MEKDLTDHGARLPQALRVAQVSKPAVSPTSKSAAAAMPTRRRFGNLRYGRLGSLRYRLPGRSLMQPCPGALRPARPVFEAGAGDEMEGYVQISPGAGR